MKKELSLLVLNQPWFVSELRQRGHEVICAGLPQIVPDIGFAPGVHLSEILQCCPPEFSPDVLICCDNSAPVTVSGLEGAPIPSLFYSVDTHHHISWHRFYALIFDAVLVAQRDYLTAIEHASVRWFPPWATWFDPLPAERPIDVCFRGTLDPATHPRRAAFFDRLREYVPVDAQGGDPRRDYLQAKIVVNEAVRGDLNFRVFEALAGGALLVTPDIGNGLHELFTDGRELITYRTDDAHDAGEKIRYYLAHPRELERIALAGHEKARQFHSAACRVDELEQILRTLTLSERRSAYFGSARAHLASISIYREMYPEISDDFLARAARDLLSSAERRERCDPPFLEAATLCRLQLERRSPSEAYSFAAALSETFPESYPLFVNLVDAAAHAAEAAPTAELNQIAGERFGRKVEEILETAREWRESESRSPR